ncbi:hypothetical protein QJS04_geneDACA014142 [Acorus gramineus]|uniref:HIT domain-containing protein n=1 Tax=Acorus gramineus TaxID=55184 RepID=A0AAV9B5B4_ACOGR|nr:hypothetical protein QJS04_geneDACA014142 [Acorus gramineus]
MERRRLGVLYNHLRPGKEEPLGLSTSNCDGGREEGVKRDGGGCVFCKITRGESPAFKIYEDDTCMCILDSNPLTCGHSLLIPKKHYPSLEATPPHVVAAMSSKVPFLSNAIMKATGCEFSKGTRGVEPRNNQPYGSHQGTFVASSND